MIKDIRYRNTLVLAILVVLLIISNYMFISLASTQSLIINENWRLLLGKDMVPLDIKIAGQTIMVLAMNIVGNELIIYNVSLSGKVNWGKTWSPSDNVTLFPLRLEIRDHYTYVPVLISNRHHLIILIIDENGAIDKKYELTTSKIIGIYDTTLLNTNIFLLAGTRYKAGYRLQYYLGKYNIETNELSNVSVWGTKDNDIITRIIYADNYKVVVLGNSTVDGQRIYILNSGGDVIYKQSIDGIVLNNMFNGDDIYVLYYISNKYYITSINLKELSTTSIFLKSLQQEPIKKLNSISKCGDYLLVMGSAYNTKYGSVYGAIYVLDKSYSVLKTILIGNPDLSTSILIGTCNENMLLASGLFGDKLFLSSYTLSSGANNWEQLLLYIITNVIIIASIIIVFYKIKK
ncbi:MAG: hypothetical protein J7J82_07975 [Staphylothermus sp.]|nr:hypothetical protein [Staphylothermus sp.]